MLLPLVPVVEVVNDKFPGLETNNGHYNSINGSCSLTIQNVTGHCSKRNCY